VIGYRPPQRRIASAHSREALMAGGALDRRRFLGALALAAAGGAAAAVDARAEAGPGAAETGVVTAVTFIHGLAGRESDLELHLLSLAAPTRAEAGCLQYDLYQSPDAPHEFMRLERWKTPGDLEAHKATPPLRASFGKRQRESWTPQITVWRRMREDV
jgi:quinol monooxygenase YgiN